VHFEVSSTKGANDMTYIDLTIEAYETIYAVPFNIDIDDLDFAMWYFFSYTIEGE
jgi:hypothetical protein